MVTKPNGLDVTTLKWKYRRDVIMITTKDGTLMNELNV